MKTIIIGIGGTGLSTIYQIRRLIAERYVQGLQAQEVSTTKFIYIDTHQNDINKFSWSVLGRSIELSPGEKLILDGANLGALAQNPQNFPAYRNWLPQIDHYVGQPGDGAKGIRPYGRLIYESNKVSVETVVNNASNALKIINQNNQLDIYLISGLSGGTGSGIFIPLSFDLQGWNIHRTDTPQHRFFSFLILPPAQRDPQWHKRYYANTYAALTELNYYAFQNPALPFNSCYLLSPENAKNTINLNSLPRLIAQRIFLNILGDNIATGQVASMMDNTSYGNIETDPVTKSKHSLRFSTFGLSAVSYPREIRAQCLACYLASKIVGKWLYIDTKPQAINQQVQNERMSMRVSDSHICGDSDVFDRPNKNYLPYKDEIDQLVDAGMLGVNKQTLIIQTCETCINIDERFRSQGINQFYAQKEEDVQQAASATFAQIRLKINTFLGSSSKGIDYAEKFLDELIKILSNVKNEFAEKSNQTNQDKVSDDRISLDRNINAVRKALESLFYGRFNDDLQGLKIKMKNYLNGKAEFASAKYAVKFLDSIIPQINQLKIDLNTCIAKMMEVDNSLLGLYQNKLLDAIKNNSNEIALLSKNDLENSVRGIDKQKNVQEGIQRIIQNKLGLKDGNFDLIVLKDQNNLLDLIYQSAYDWIVTDSSLIDTKQSNFYDKFVELFPTSQARQQILQSAKQASESLLYNDPAQVAIDIIKSTVHNNVTRPNTTGGTDDNQQPTNQLVLNDLLTIGIPQDKILESSDQERIIFLEEKQVFPLRYIQLLSILKNDYDLYKDKLALHIDKTIVANLDDLYLLTNQQQNEIVKAEKVWYMSIAYQLLELEINQSTGQVQVCYKYNEMGINICVLGSNWDESYKNFRQDAISSNVTEPEVRDARLRLTAKVDNIWQTAKVDAQTVWINAIQGKPKPTTKLQAETMWEKAKISAMEYFALENTLENYLKQVLQNECQGNAQHEYYQKLVKIIKNIMNDISPISQLIF